MELIGDSLLHPGHPSCSALPAEHLMRCILLLAVCMDALDGADRLQEGEHHCDVVG